MAESITIPSPSVFLRSSPVPTPPNPQPKQHERKRSTNTKEKDRDKSSKKKKTRQCAVDKPKQSKSRNGCSTCKTKRLKCDENKPGCDQCRKRKVECGGYKKEFKWRTYDERTNRSIPGGRGVFSFACDSFAGLSESADQPIELDHACAPSSTNPVSSSDGLPKSISFDQQGIFTPPEEEISIDPILTAKEALPSATTEDRVNHSRHGSNELSIDLNDGVELHDDAAAVVSLCLRDMQPMANRGQDVFSVTAPPSASPRDEVPYPLSDSPPALPDHFSNLDLGIIDPNQSVLNLVEHAESPEQWMLTRDTIPQDSAFLGGLFDDDADDATSPMPLEDTLPPESDAMIALRFDRFTCGILSVKDGPNENPWRTLIWPMTKNSPALLHAMSAMSAFHSSRDIPVLREVGQTHTILSIRNLGEGINDGSMRLDTAIATCLALGFAQGWDLPTYSGNDHIRGARSLMRIALEKHREQPLDGANLARLKFLCNAWVYMDVIARMTSTDSDETDDYQKVFLAFNDPSAKTAGFGIDFGLPIDAHMDPLMGCASTLFPLIGRTANLVRRVRRSPSNSPAIISQAMELKLLLETWDYPEFIEPPEDPSSTVEHSVQTAEAYRWATLLYLHQAVPEIPSPTSLELADRVLCYLATVPLASRFVITHIFPLMAAGCEACTGENRQWVQERWMALSMRLRIGSTDRCLEVTKEVWQRRDTREARPPPRRGQAHSGLAQNHQIHVTRPDPFSSIASDMHEREFDQAAASRPPCLRRRTIDEGVNRVLPTRRASVREPLTGSLDPEHTVRGGQHWLAVMRDWDWEVLLG